jgi:hypothetical protein
MSLLELVEKFNNFDFNYFRIKPNISFLKDFKNKKILMLGYKKWETSFNNYLFTSLDKIEKKIKNYDLIVIGPAINYCKRKYILNLLKIMDNKKKSFIFYGYTSNVNFNLENTRNMFRPIDITKYPFNIHKYKILEESILYSRLILIIISIITTIYLIYTSDKQLYKVFLLVLIAIMFILPRKKILYIKYD